MPDSSACASSRRTHPVPRWTDLADLLNDIRSPQQEEVADAIRSVCGDTIGPATVERITDAVMGLYRRRHQPD